MNRLMMARDIAPLTALWIEAFGDSAAFAEQAIRDFAGVENVFVCEENEEIASMLLAVPVSMCGKKGAYFYGLATKKSFRKQGKMAALMEYAADYLKNHGVEFITLIPENATLFSYYEKHGFTKAFAHRIVKREIHRNIWSQAEFDSVTAKTLLSLRERFCPSAVQLPLAQMMLVLGNLYSQGITIVSNENGYGLYKRKDKTLYFLELQAETDRFAEQLCEAAREREVFAEEAVFTVGASQTLFLGQGTPCDYGMIRFLGKPFDIFDGYMCLMLDEFSV